jgi:hypothetical protein
MSYTKFYISEIICPKCNKSNLGGITEELNEPIYFYCQYCDFEEVYQIETFAWQSEKRMKEIQEETKEWLNSLSGKPLKYEKT